MLFALSLCNLLKPLEIPRTFGFGPFEVLFASCRDIFLNTIWNPSCGSFSGMKVRRFVIPGRSINNSWWLCEIKNFHLKSGTKMSLVDFYVMFANWSKNVRESKNCLCSTNFLSNEYQTFSELQKIRNVKNHHLHLLLFRSLLKRHSWQ